MENNPVEIWTDGSCLGNDSTKISPGGWSVSLRYTKENGVHLERDYSGGEKNTTNNRMEIKAVLEGLKAIRSDSRINLKINIYTDSQYVISCIPKLELWQDRNWKKTDGKKAKNSDLWELVLAELDRLIPRVFTWNWVEGHIGIVLQEMCDRAARFEAERMRDDISI